MPTQEQRISEFSIDQNLAGIVAANEENFNRFYRDAKGDVWMLCGVLIASDDYYFLMLSNRDTKMLSCVGSIEQHGFFLTEDRP